MTRRKRLEAGDVLCFLFWFPISGCFLFCFGTHFLKLKVTPVVNILSYCSRIWCLNSCSSEEEAVSKRRELSKENTDGEEATANSGDTNDDLPKGPPLSPAKVDGEGDTSPLL
ncbi:unnamed protein product [Prunus armeniaca]|uniref:Uncharacterized protein n=1 Tax=Prunus armeniaca TaxID=36596 RepID=A0A6J5UJP8_PRUAR|nr:unnamed protein product [Prunus armeniaca]